MGCGVGVGCGVGFQAYRSGVVVAAGAQKIPRALWQAQEAKQLQAGGHSAEPKHPTPARRVVAEDAVDELPAEVREAAAEALRGAVDVAEEEELRTLREATRSLRLEMTSFERGASISAAARKSRFT